MVLLAKPSATWIKEDTQLDQEGLILVALLCGNDVGVGGCDIGTAIQLARSGLGKELVEASRHLVRQPQALIEFVHSWRARVRDELSFNIGGYLEQRHPELAACIDDHFPSLEVLEYYANSPTQLHSDDVKCLNGSLRPTLPNMAGIVSFCREQFRWSDDDISWRFKLSLYKGAICRMLHSPLVVYNEQEKTFHDRTWKLKLLKESPQHRVEQDVEQVEATFSLAGLVKIAALNVVQPTKETIWIPRSVLQTIRLPRGLSQAKYDQAASGTPDVERLGGGIEEEYPSVVMRI
ncbi:hypothetical protein AAF712_011283 [Marasmius tenuissimus]|uniref:Uncharacterized protein n=1 Tax=Marasmius tenuissimus TaxID=585030 RepID=A0ABR2ZJV9_9AGAR